MKYKIQDNDKIDITNIEKYLKKKFLDYKNFIDGYKILYLLLPNELNNNNTEEQKLPIEYDTTLELLYKIFNEKLVDTKNLINNDKNVYYYNIYKILSNILQIRFKIKINILPYEKIAIRNKCNLERKKKEKKIKTKNEETFLNKYVFKKDFFQISNFIILYYDFNEISEEEKIDINDIFLSEYIVLKKNEKAFIKKRLIVFYDEIIYPIFYYLFEIFSEVYMVRNNLVIDIVNNLKIDFIIELQNIKYLHNNSVNYIYSLGLNYKIYRRLNLDLKNYNNLQLKEHFNIYGRNENRIYNFETLLKKNIYLIYFDLQYYKEHNKDLKFNNDIDYVLDYLENRINDNREISFKLSNFKKEKQKLIQGILNITTQNNFFIKPYKIGINETESVSEWANDSDINKLIKESKLVLNIGAGYRTNIERYFSLSNVINTEVFNYPTTDIVCDGDNLPFKDNSFDFILSLAVLEHVKNPWIHAEEIIRVLKPGGIIYVDVPFLQPYHGYPHHYYNMTTKGLQNLFNKKIKIIKHYIPDWSKPIFTLTWFLNKYCDFLDKNSREKFKKLTVEEILKNGNNLNLEYVKNFNKDKEEIIACGSTLIGKKI